MNLKSIYAIAVSQGQALQIEEDLTRVGFSNEEISALIPDGDSSSLMTSGVGLESRQPAAVGGVLGAAMEMFASTGLLAIPGVGQLIAVGPLLAALNGIATGAAFVGMGAALVGLGIPQTAAKRYEHRLAGGEILISVQAKTAEQVQRAKQIFKNSKAEDIAVASFLPRNAASG